MSASLFQRRRADRFAQLVEEAAGGRRHRTRSTDDEKLRELVALTGRVADLPLTVEAHPEFREGLRAMLMATIEREGIGTTARPESAQSEPDPQGALAAAAAKLERRRERRRARTLSALVAGLAAGALALSGISAASGDALPGDLMYGIKRQTERAQLALTGSDLDRGQLRFDLAKTRLDEARAVKGDAVKFASTMDAMDDESRGGVRLLHTTAVEHRDATAIDAVETFIAVQRPALEKLRGELTGAARTRVEASLDLLRRAAARSAVLRQLLPCAATATGDADDFGPAPKVTRCPGQPAGTGQDEPATGGPTTKPARPDQPQPNQSATAGGGATQKTQVTAGTPPTMPQTPAPTMPGSSLSGGPGDVIGGTHS